MPRLKKDTYEALAQALAEGCNISEAGRRAKFSSRTATSFIVAKRPEVIARIKEIRAQKLGIIEPEEDAEPDLLDGLRVEIVTRLRRVMELGISLAEAGDASALQHVVKAASLLGPEVALFLKSNRAAKLTENQAFNLEIHLNESKARQEKQGIIIDSKPVEVMEN